MKKIFSPIIILSMILTLFSFGCNRLAIYKQHESNNPGYLASFFFLDLASGNCAIGVKGPAGIAATAQQLPKLVCKDPAVYYVGGADEATNFTVAAQILADQAAKNLSVFSIILNAPDASCGPVTTPGTAKAIIAGLPAAPTPAVLYAAAAAGCVQVTTAFALDQLYYCRDTTQQTTHAGTRSGTGVGSLRYELIGDIKTDTAFATNYAAQVALLPVGSFDAAQTAKTNTLDPAWSGTMYKTPEGSAFTFVNTYIPGNTCGRWLIDPAPAGAGYSNVRSQVARQGATANNTLYGITAVDIGVVTSPIVYDILLLGGNRVGLGLICGAAGALPAGFTKASGGGAPAVGNCTIAGTGFVTW